MANLIVPLRQICCGMKTLSGPPRLDLSICIENGMIDLLLSFCLLCLLCLLLTRITEETFEDINKMDLEEWRKGNKGPLSRKIYKLGFPECPICMVSFLVFVSLLFPLLYPLSSTLFLPFLLKIFNYCDRKSWRLRALHRVHISSARGAFTISSARMMPSLPPSPF